MPLLVTRLVLAPTTYMDAGGGAARDWQMIVRFPWKPSSQRQDDGADPTVTASKQGRQGAPSPQKSLVSRSELGILSKASEMTVGASLLGGCTEERNKRPGLRGEGVGGLDRSPPGGPGCWR